VNVERVGRRKRRRGRVIVLLMMIMIDSMIALVRRPDHDPACSNVDKGSAFRADSANERKGTERV
jgi:hypothetical protein